VIDERLRADIVDDTLRVPVECLRARDLERVRNLFSDDAVLFGSEAGETVQGTVGLRTFHRDLRSAPDPRMDLGAAARDEAQRHPVVRRPASVELHGDDGESQSLSYGLSGVLRERAASRWTFELFNGSEPAAG
jgi:ketosteroid isomerase-like protein